MYKKTLLFIALIVLYAPLALFSQEAVVVDGDHPFIDNFEGATCQWEFVNGTSTNAWAWGTATCNSGSHSVYISQDGGTTNTYNISATTWVYFWKLITIGESGSYRFSYDWKCQGYQNGYDYIRVGLLPESATLTQGSQYPTSSWISLDDNTQLYNNSNWTTRNANINITAGTYKMVFAWYNNPWDGSNPPGAIDNVGITKWEIGNHTTYVTQTSTTDFRKGTGSNVNIANGNVTLQYKMASVDDWSATTNLPQTLKAHQVATWRTYVYCVGGNNGSNPVSTVYRATQQTSGVSSWTELNALPEALQDMAVIATQTHLVVIGGRNNGTVSDKIYSALINDDGSIGAWEECSVSLPQPCWGACVVEALGNLYVIGGANTDTENDASNKVYRLTLNAMGEVAGITPMTNLPEARNGHAVTVYNSKIIVTGGYDASFTPKNTVYSITVKLNGSLGTWQIKTALPNAVYGHTTVCTNGILTVIGGIEGSLQSNKFYYTDADASTYNWQLSDIQLPERYTEGASFAFGNKIFYCGGENLSSSLNNAVRFMAVNRSTSPVGHPVFVSWPFNIGTPKQMVELNYNLINMASQAYEVLYRTAGENQVFSNWTSVGTSNPIEIGQTKSFIQYMFRITATGSENFTIENVTLTLNGYSQLAANLNLIGTLTAESSPYLVTETISFTSGTHNIEPGVVIQFMPNTGLNIGAARVNFNGTEASPILLTAYEGGSGSWNGVYYQDASDNSGITSVMEYTTIEKAGNGDNHANLRLYATNQPTINHCSFNLSSNDGIFFENNSSPQCTSCTMGNNNNGINLSNSAPTFTNCTMTGNTFAGINFATTNFNATFTGVTCSDNLYGLYSCSPNRSFTFDESAIAFADNGSDIAVAGGQISSNQTWNYYANGYALLGDVSVYQSGGAPKLTIVPGNTIKVQAGCYFYVGYNSNYGGMLYAVGTAEDPIIFTSLNGENGGWNGLRFRDGSDYNSSSSLRYCVVEKATTNLYCTNTNQPSVMWCTFQNSTNHNVVLYNQANISIEGCTMKNAPRGLCVESNSNPTVISTVFENLSDACVRHYSTDNTVTYSNCTMKDSRIGIRYYIPNMDLNEVDNVSFENMNYKYGVNGGDIVNNRQWNVSSIAVMGTVRVGGNNTEAIRRLTLSPGTTLGFAAETGMQISWGVYYRGELNAVGTAEAPITFTSLNGQNGGWSGLYFSNYSDYASGMVSVLEHCVIEKGDTYNLYMDNTNQPSQINNCIFKDATGRGVYIYGSTNMADCQILDNGSDGLYFKNSGNMVMTDCEVHDNGDNGVKSETAMLNMHNVSLTNNGGYGMYYTNAHYMNVMENVEIEDNTLGQVALGGGDITGNRTWSAFTYDILGTIRVGGNNTEAIRRLTLLPGTTLGFAAGTGMQISWGTYYRGELNAVGTAEAPITFTSLNGQNGGWSGLYFSNYSDYVSGMVSVLEHCIIEKGDTYNLYMENTNQPSVIKNCTFQKANGYGLYLDNASPNVSNCFIKNNVSYGIYLNNNAQPIVGGTIDKVNSIYGNGDYEVYQNGSKNINMTYNFWGQADPLQVDEELVYDKMDDSSKGRVTVNPTCLFPVEDFAHVQGTFTYNGDNARLMTNCEMNIINVNDSIMATTTTNANGIFDFNNYQVSVYNTLDNNFGVDILAGVNATDALLVMRHFVHLDTLAPKYATLADVNGSGSINGTDAMLILRRAIDEEFPIGNFYYFSPNGISVEGNTCTYDLSFLCYGDVNGSYTPATRNNTIELMTEGQLVAESNQELVLPVSIKNAVEMGALTLRFAYPEEYLEIEDVVLAATGESLIFSANEGMLTTAWFSLEPIALAENDELIIVKVRTKDLSNIDEPVTFSLNAYSEMADVTAQVLDDVVIAMPAIITETLGMSDNTMDATHLTIYPNPANDVCRLSYQLAEAGRVTVSVYNLMGVKVMDAANCRQDEGKHEIRMTISDLAAGMYTCRITFEGENSWVKTTLLIIEK